MADVFISYKKEDRALAQRVVAALEREGFSVWWDDDITPRESWDAMIQREAESAKAMVVLWTPRSIASDWVRAEAGLGKARNKLVPFLMEPCELPLAFSLLQAADLTRWRGAAEDAAWRKAVGWVSDQCGRPASAPMSTASSKQVRASRSGLWFALAAVLVIGGGAAAGLFLLNRPKVPAPLEQAAAAPTAAATPSEPPLPPGELGEAEALRRRFLAAESVPQCEGQGVVYFEAQSAEIAPETAAAALDPIFARLSACEISAVLVAGHADAAEKADGFALARRRAQAVAEALDEAPRAAVLVASFGAEAPAVQTADGIRLVENRRVEVDLRGLPRADVADRAYQKLGLGDARSRAQLFANILFGYNLARFSEGDENAKLILKRWRDLLAENPGVKLEIAANGGNDGESLQYSAALRQRRANMVRDYLVSLGADAGRLSTMVESQDKALPGTDVVTRMANRSVTLRQAP